jgi:restriction system protein
MPIPDYQAFMLPLLRLASDGKDHKKSEVVKDLAEQFNLTKQDKEALLPSGSQLVYVNRIGWAATYLKKAGLLSAPKRAVYQITERGRALLATNPKEVRTKTLEQYDEFNAFKTKIKAVSSEENAQVEPPTSMTPEEALEWGFQNLTQSLSEELLSKIASCQPAFFENLVVELLVKMGYGGSKKEAAQIVGKAGDAGIDGIIKEDKLGLDTIYVQAKRWENVVGRPEIQRFAGALLGKKAKKGIFITTSSLTKEASDYAESIDAKIILIDGEHLAAFMIENNLGVNTAHTYEIKRIDSDYFSEED